MDQKQQVRTEVREARGARAGDRRGERDAFTARLASLVSETRARRVTCFVNIGAEPDTSGFLAWAREHGIEVLLPRVLSGENVSSGSSALDGEMEWALLDDRELIPGAFGIPEPQGPGFAHDKLGTVDLMLIPAAAVDRSGTRLGWGRGFFDRALAEIHREPSTAPPVFAVVYEDEIFNELPAEPHDHPVSGAVTEIRVRRFG